MVEAMIETTWLFILALAPLSPLVAVIVLLEVDDWLRRRRER